MERIVVSVLLALCIASAQESINDIDSQCLERASMSEDELLEITTNGEDFGENPRMKCFADCIFEKLHIMRNCRINYELLFVDGRDVSINEYRMCRPAVNAGERCECAYQLTKCLQGQKGAGGN